MKELPNKNDLMRVKLRNKWLLLAPDTAGLEADFHETCLGCVFDSARYASKDGGCEVYSEFLNKHNCSCGALDVVFVPVDQYDVYQANIVAARLHWSANHGDMSGFKSIPYSTRKKSCPKTPR